MEDKPGIFAKLIVRSGGAVSLSQGKDDNMMERAKRTEKADAHLRLLDEGNSCWHCCGRELATVVTRVCRGCRKVSG